MCKGSYSAKECFVNLNKAHGLKHKERNPAGWKTDLPAGFTELFDINRAAECDDEDGQRVGRQAVVTHHCIQHL